MKLISKTAHFKLEKRCDDVYLLHRHTATEPQVLYIAPNELQELSQMLYIAYGTETEEVKK